MDNYALDGVQAARMLRRWQARPDATPGPEYVLQQHRRFLTEALRDLADAAPTRLIDGIKAAITELERIDCTKCGRFEHVVDDDRCAEHVGGAATPKTSQIVDLAEALKKAGLR